MALFRAYCGLWINVYPTAIIVSWLLALYARERFKLYESYLTLLSDTTMVDLKLSRDNNNNFYRTRECREV